MKMLSCNWRALVCVKRVCVSLKDSAFPPKLKGWKISMISYVICRHSAFALNVAGCCCCHVLSFRQLAYDVGQARLHVKQLQTSSVICGIA